MPSSCVCVCLSVTLQYCIKTAKRKITQITPHDSPGTDAKDHGEIQTGSPPNGGKCKWSVLKLAAFDRKRTITQKQYKIDAYFLFKSNRK